MDDHDANSIRWTSLEAVIHEDRVEENDAILQANSIPSPGACATSLCHDSKEARSSTSDNSDDALLPTSSEEDLDLFTPLTDARTVAPVQRSTKSEYSTLFDHPDKQVATQPDEQLATQSDESEAMQNGIAPDLEDRSQCPEDDISWFLLSGVMEIWGGFCMGK